MNAKKQKMKRGLAEAGLEVELLRHSRNPTTQVIRITEVLDSLVDIATAIVEELPEEV